MSIFQKKLHLKIAITGFDTLKLSRDALAELLLSANKSLPGKLFW